MPSLSVDITADPLRALSTASLPLDNHILKAAVLFCPAANTWPGDAYASIRVCSGSPDPATTVALLAAGYLSGSEALGWTGSLPVEPSSYLVAFIYSTTAATYRLACSLWRPIIEDGRIVGLDP